MKAKKPTAAQEKVIGELNHKIFEIMTRATSKQQKAFKGVLDETFLILMARIESGLER